MLGPAEFRGQYIELVWSSLHRLPSVIRVASTAVVLASVAVDLRAAQVVDVPNYEMTAVLNKGVFVEA